MIVSNLERLSQLPRFLRAIPLLLLCLPSLASAENTISGRVTKVRDVDTIVVAGTPIRLNGGDGPETSTRIGKEAKYC